MPIKTAKISKKKRILIIIFISLLYLLITLISYHSTEKIDKKYSVQIKSAIKNEDTKELMRIAEAKGEETNSVIKNTAIAYIFLAIIIFISLHKKNREKSSNKLGSSSKNYKH